MNYDIQRGFGSWRILLIILANLRILRKIFSLSMLLVGTVRTMPEFPSTIWLFTVGITVKMKSSIITAETGDAVFRIYGLLANNAVNISRSQALVDCAIRMLNIPEKSLTPTAPHRQQGRSAWLKTDILPHILAPAWASHFHWLIHICPGIEADTAVRFLIKAFKLSKITIGICILWVHQRLSIFL